MSDDRCPKCGEERRGESCPKCGLVFERFDAAALEAGVPEEIRGLWSHVEEGWDDPARHALFLERAIAAGAGGYAAGMYRRRGDDAVAAEQIERLTARLQQMLAEASAPAAEKSGRLGHAVAMLLLLLLGAAVGAVLYAALVR